MKKNFLLGVGCQKGGTTWLHSQLKKSTRVDLGFAKEYHLFDVLHVPACRGILTRQLQWLRNTRPLGLDQLKQREDLVKKLSFYVNTNNYYDYFDYLWYKGGDEVTTVGDITPEYATLPVSALQEVKAKLEAKGFNVKVVFLMRDPIERCWSRIRMIRRNALTKDSNAILPSEREQIEEYFVSNHCEIRTRYENTINNLEQVFDSKDIFYSLYERLFTPETLSAFKSFSGIEDFNPDISHRENASAKSGIKELDRVLGEKIFKHYQSTYEFCDRRFDTKELWTGWKYS